MYHVRVIKQQSVVEHHMIYEPLDSLKERQLLNGREGCWLDIERIPFDQHIDYVLESEDHDSECT